MSQFTETKALWNKAHARLTEIYGIDPDIRVLNRFHTEKMAFGKSDCVVLWDLIAKLKALSQEAGFIASMGGTGGSCFTAFLLGATENDPLPLHYYCPACKNVEFLEENAVPYDVPSKTCLCGAEMRADGFRIPYESYLPMANDPHALLFVAPDFFETAKAFLAEGVDEYRTVPIQGQEEEVAFALLPKNFRGDPEEGDLGLPRIAVRPSVLHGEMSDLQKQAAVKLADVPFGDPALISALAAGEVADMPVFRDVDPNCLDLFETFRSVKPQSATALFQMIGAFHGAGSWVSSLPLIREGICSLERILAYREDVFFAIQDKMTALGCRESGFALAVSENARRGRYSSKEMDEETYVSLIFLDLEEWVIPYLEKVAYLFPKAHGAEFLKFALAATWYRRNAPRA